MPSYTCTNVNTTEEPDMVAQTYPHSREGLSVPQDSAMVFKPFLLLHPLSVLPAPILHRGLHCLGATRREATLCSACLK